MNVRPRVQPPGRRDEGVDKVVVPLAPDALRPEAEVEVVAQQLRVVGAAVEDHGEAAVRMDAGAQRREGQLGDGDEDAPDALVSDAQYLLAVCARETRPSAADGGGGRGQQMAAPTCHDNVVNVLRVAP